MGVERGPEADSTARVKFFVGAELAVNISYEGEMSQIVVADYCFRGSAVVFFILL